MRGRPKKIKKTNVTEIIEVIKNYGIDNDIICKFSKECIKISKSTTPILFIVLVNRVINGIDVCYNDCYNKKYLTPKSARDLKIELDKFMGKEL